MCGSDAAFCQITSTTCIIIGGIAVLRIRPITDRVAWSIGWFVCWSVTVVSQ